MTITSNFRPLKNSDHLILRANREQENAERTLMRDDASKGNERYMKAVRVTTQRAEAARRLKIFVANYRFDDDRLLHEIREFAAEAEIAEGLTEFTVFFRETVAFFEGILADQRGGYTEYIPE
jgi:predicted TIM-barrel fold metal-dependent hydrolase